MSDENKGTCPVIFGAIGLLMICGGIGAMVIPPLGISLIVVGSVLVVATILVAMFKHH